MRITVNDDEVRLEEGVTVTELLARLGYPDRGIAVAVNWAVLPRSHWDQPVPDGARLDVVTAVQGG